MARRNKSYYNRNRVRIRNSILFLSIFTLTIFVVLVIYNYADHVTKDIQQNFYPSQRADLGQFGDYFGGTLNPIFGLASFLALLVTIFYQAKELEYTRQELINSTLALRAQNKSIELQSFEQTFFSWLDTYHELLGAIEYEQGTNKKGLSGKHQLKRWWENTFSAHILVNKLRVPSKKNIFSIKQVSFEYECKDLVAILKPLPLRARDKLIKDFLVDIPERYSSNIPKLILNEWEILYKSEEYQLDSPFKILYRLLLWIDTQDESRLLNSQKWLYVSIIRSQLSWIELAYLYINGLTVVGKKFKPLAEKYAFYDNLTFDSDVSLQILKKHLIEPNGYSPHAYDSALAKELLGLPQSSE